MSLRSPVAAASAVAVSALLVMGRNAVATTDQGWILSSTGGTTSPTATTGGGTGNWDTAANWSAGYNASNANAGRFNIDNGGTVIINFTGTETTTNDVTTSGYQNATTAGGQGTYLQQSGTLNVSGWFRMAEGASSGGTFNVAGGTTNVTGGYVNLGEAAGAVGVIDVTGGTFTMGNGTNNEPLNVGEGTGTGVINITAGTFADNSTKGYGDIGNGGIGIMNVSGGSYTSTLDDLNLDDAANNSGTLTVSGTGTVSIGGRYLYIGKFSGGTGTLNLNGGNVSAGSVSGVAYGATTGGTSIINFNGGMLSATTTGNSSTANGNNAVFLFDISQANVLAGGAIFNTNNIYTTINQSLVNGTGGGQDGGLNVSGGATVVLLKANTFTGNIIVTGTTLRFAGDAMLGADPSSVNTSDITLNNGEILNNSGNNLVLNANRGIVVNGTGYFEPGYGPGSPFTGTYIPGGTTGGGIQINGPISGPGNVAITYDASTVTLNGSDTYAGSTMIGSTGPQGTGSDYYNNITASPTLQLGSGNANAIPVGSPLVFTQHPNQPTGTVTLDLNGNSPVFGGVTSATANAIIDNSSGSSASITMGQGTIAGTISTYVGVVRNSDGIVSVAKTGLGTQLLSGANSYNGSTSVAAGKLYVNGIIGSASGSTLTVTGGTFGGAATVNSPATVSAGGTIESGYLGIGSLNLAAGLAFTGSGNIQIGSISAAGSNALNVSGGTLDSGGNTVTVNVASAAGLLSVGSKYDLVNYTSLAAYSGVAGFDGFVIGSLPSRAVGTLVNVPAGGTSTAGMLELLVTNTDYLVWTGAASIGSPTAPWDIQTTANFKLNSTGAPSTYTDNPGDSVLFDDTATGPTAVTLNTTVHPASVTFNNSNLTYSITGTGSIAGTTTITKNGTGTTLISTSNSYTGSTTINSGTLQAGSATAFGISAPMIIANNATATLALNGNNLSIGSLSGGGSTGGTINLGANTLTDGTLNVSDEFDGAINGTGSVTKVGTATLTLTGASNYSGGTTVSAGTLSVTNVGDTGTSAIGTGPVLVTGVFNYAGTGTGTTARSFNLSNGGYLSVSNPASTLSLTGTVIGASTLNVKGVGTVLLTGTDTAANFFPYSGTTIIGTGGSLTTTNYESIALSAGAVATVTVTGTGRLIDSNDFNVTDLTGGFATLNIQGSAYVQVATPYIGKSGTSTGIVNQTGGTFNQSGGGDFRIGGGTGIADIAAVGIWSISAGNINTPNNVQVGSYGNGELNISGTGAFLSTGGFTTIGRYTTGYGVVDVSGGSFTATTNHLIIGEQGNGTLTVRGGTASSTGVIWVGGTEVNDTATGQVNLDSGTLTAPGFLMGALSDLSTFNFNGGLLQASGSSTTYMQGLTNAYVFHKGANIDTAGNAITIAQNLQDVGAASGGPGGITSVTVTTGGTGFTAAPIVEISGGGGFGATAVAQMSGGAITGIVITNPGTGYSSAPTITLVNGLSGGTGATFNPVITNVSSGGLTVYSSVHGGALTLSGSNTYLGPTNVSGGALVIAVDGALPANNIVTVALGSTLVLPDMSTFSSIASLNLNGNMIVQNGTLATISAAAGVGYHSGNWNGTGGITSSAAASDTAHLHALGVIQNSIDGTTTGSVLYGFFEGQNSVDTDVLVKYTYYGDTDLNGSVDGTDYGRIDNAFLNNLANPTTPLTGWFNGDFNYDGVINGSDYTLMDNAFNSQGAVISAQVATATAQVGGGSAVPEPTSLAILGIGAVGILGRRRRAH